MEDPKYLTPFLKEILNTGFDVFILLTIFKDAFPNHEKLKPFDWSPNVDIFRFLQQKRKFSKKKEDTRFSEFMLKKFAPLQKIDNSNYYSSSKANIFYFNFFFFSFLLYCSYCF